MLTTGCVGAGDGYSDNLGPAKEEAKAWLMELLRRANVLDASPVRLARVEPCHVQRFSERQRENKMKELKRLRFKWDDIKARLDVQNQIDCVSYEEQQKLKVKKRKLKTKIKEEMVALGEDPEQWLSFTAESDDMASSSEDACCVYTRTDLQ